MIRLLCRLFGHSWSYDMDVCGDWRTCIRCDLYEETP